MSSLSKPHLHDEAAAYRFVEAILWPNGPICPRCKETRRVGKLNGKSTRIGVYKCYVCRKPFRVTCRTIFESSHVPLHKWLQAFLLLCASKKGISSHQLARTLDIQVRSAWFLSHRIREAMRSGELAPLVGIVEIDETAQGRLAESPPGRQRGEFRGFRFRNVVLSLVERGGSVRSFHVSGHSIAELMPVINANVSREAQIMTDSAVWYRNMNIDGTFVSHERVNHDADEYARYDFGRPVVHTNTVEGYFSLFKRGMKGIYQHCSEKHLHRYLAEFDFRYSNRIRLGIDDQERARRALHGVAGKRLTYKKTSQDRTQTR
jgi:transposase-like protein